MKDFDKICGIIAQHTAAFEKRQALELQEKINCRIESFNRRTRAEQSDFRHDCILRQQIIDRTTEEASDRKFYEGINLLKSYLKDEGGFSRNLKKLCQRQSDSILDNQDTPINKLYLELAQSFFSEPNRDGELCLTSDKFIKLFASKVRYYYHYEIRTLDENEPKLELVSRPVLYGDFAMSSLPYLFKLGVFIIDTSIFNELSLPLQQQFKDQLFKANKNFAHCLYRRDVRMFSIFQDICYFENKGKSFRDILQEHREWLSLSIRMDNGNRNIDKEYEIEGLKRLQNIQSIIGSRDYSYTISFKTLTGRTYKELIESDKITDLENVSNFIEDLDATYKQCNNKSHCHLFYKRWQFDPEYLSRNYPNYPDMQIPEEVLADPVTLFNLLRTFLMFNGPDLPLRLLQLDTPHLSSLMTIRDNNNNSIFHHKNLVLFQKLKTCLPEEDFKKGMFFVNNEGSTAFHLVANELAILNLLDPLFCHDWPKIINLSNLNNETPLHYASDYCLNFFIQRNGLGESLPVSLSKLSLFKPSRKNNKLEFKEIDKSFPELAEVIDELPISI